MIKATQLVQQFDLCSKKYSSKGFSSINLVDKLLYLNNSIRYIFNKRAKDAEVDDEARRSLVDYEVKNFNPKRIHQTTEFDFFEIPSDSFRLLKKSVDIGMNNCEEKVRNLSLTFVQTDDLDRMRNDSNWKSSFLWENVLADEGSYKGTKGIFVYHDSYKSGITVDKMTIDYFTNPEEIQAPSLHEKKEYIDWNNKLVKNDVNLKMDAGVDPQIIAEVAYILSTDNSNVGISEINKILLLK